MRSTLALCTPLLLFAAAAPASAALSDFRLPPAPTGSQPSSDRQGPVAPDVPESRRSAPQPSPTPTASAPAPTPSPTVTPPRVVPPPPLAPAPTTTPKRRAPTPRATAPADEIVRTPATGTPAPPTLAAEPDAPAAASPLPPPPAAPLPAQSADDRGSIWPWLGGGLLALAGLALAVMAARRRRTAAGTVTVPEIERPRLPPTPTAADPPQSAAPALAAAPAAVAAPASPRPARAAPTEPVHLSLEPLRMSLTLINAALAYRLEVTNRGPIALTGLAIGADMIAAHASMTREQHLDGPANGAVAGRIERLEPGESRVIEGEFRVPFSHIVPIRQGSAALLLPLARFRIEAEGTRPVVRTFAVGQPGNGALQPFRLDQGPRVYPRLAQRAFA